MKISEERVKADNGLLPSIAGQAGGECMTPHVLAYGFSDKKWL